MRKLLVVLLVVMLVLAVAASVALAQYPGTMLWKNECPPWATVRLVEQPDGWTFVHCYTFDAMGER